MVNVKKMADEWFHCSLPLCLLIDSADTFSENVSLSCPYAVLHS
jgi:hypothetical protein